MPEPKKPIEELLEASARARRAEFGADPKMPNPMRARLHEEIARLDNNAQRKPRRSWFAAFWPQISLTTAVAAVLVTASVVWFRAQNRNSAAMPLAMQQPAPAPADVSAPLRSLDAVTADHLAKNDVNESAALSSNESIAAAPPAESAPAVREQAETKSFASVAQAPVAAKAAAPATAERSVAQARQFHTRNLPQRFSQNIDGARRETMKQQSPNLLKTFDVQQEGDRIRVVDQDGSTYTGKLEQLAQNDSRSLGQKKEQNATVAMKRAREADEYFFRASGFNNSLKKNVVLEANFVAPPAQNERSAPQKKSLTEEQHAPARIVGTAKMAGEPPVEIDAVSVER